MSSGALASERVMRLLAQVRERLAAQGPLWQRRHELVAVVRRNPRRSAAVVAGVLAALVLLSKLFGSGVPEGVVLAEAREGPFQVMIVEAGTLQALRSVTYASSIQSNQAKIVAMAPEGKMVQKGDLLLLFDAAPFEEEIRKSNAQLLLAQSDLQKARQDFNLQAIQNTEEMAAARQKVEQTDFALKDVEEGKGRVSEHEAELAVANALRDLKKAEGALEDLRPLLKEGFITKQELEKAEQAVERAKEDAALVQRRRDSLVNFGRPMELSKARSDALITKESVRQLESSANFRLEQKKAAIAGAESRIQEAASKLALTQQQLARTEVRADVPGIVVYRDVFFGSEQRKPQVGDQVWANQPLLILPDISKMVVETRVRETDIHKVEKNQHVSVHVEAYPDLKLSGAVTLVGTLAQEERERRGSKFFSVTVQIVESEPRLRPGMSARVEIQVEERASALSVPLEAVFEHDGGHVCYVAGHGGLTPHPVVLGPSNHDFVVIEQGLVAGDRIALRDPGAPPSDFGALATP